MNRRLVRKILRRCPIIYRYESLGPQYNLICFGFECGDGWYQLIYDLSVAVEQKAQSLKDDFVDDCLLPSVSQVKEKHGGLRFYVNNIYDAFSDLIDEAEDKSYEICELCGKPGKVRGTAWKATLCDDCE